MASPRKRDLIAAVPYHYRPPKATQTNPQQHICPTRGAKTAWRKPRRGIHPRLSRCLRARLPGKPKTSILYCQHPLAKPPSTAMFGTTPYGCWAVVCKVLGALASIAMTVRPAKRSYIMVRLSVIMSLATSSVSQQRRMHQRTLPGIAAHGLAPPALMRNWQITTDTAY